MRYPAWRGFQWIFFLSLAAHLVVALVFLLVSQQAVFGKSPGNLLQANLSMNSSWNYSEEKQYGRTAVTIQGKLELNKQFSSAEQGMPAVMLPYKAVSLKGTYTYKDTQKPSEDCTITYDASGDFTIEAYPGPGNLIVHGMGTLAEQLGQIKSMAPAGAFDALIDRYLFAVTVPPQEIEGKKICKDKKETVRKRILGNKIEIHYQFSEDGTMSGQRSWTADFYPPTNSVSVSLLPTVFNAKPYSPPKDSSGEISYTLNWQIKEPSAVQIVRLDPNDPYGDGEDITDQKQSIDVGEKILLKAFLYPKPSNQSKLSGRWTIPGKVLKDWQANHSRSTRTEVPKEDFKRDEIEFFWFDVEQGGEEHRITFKPHGKNATGTTTFEVRRPDISLSVEAGSINHFHLQPMQLGILLDERKCCVTYTSAQKDNAEFCRYTLMEIKRLAAIQRNSRLEDHYQDLLREYREECQAYGIQYEGITFTGKPPEQFDGEIQYVQLIRINNDTQGKTKPWGLDGCYPYPPNRGPFSTYDAPGFSDPGPGKSRYRDLSFSMYLMYRPEPKYKNAHAWVPLYKVDWTWAGKIICDSNGDCRHDYEADKYTTNAKVKKQHDYPKWNTCN